MVYAATAGPTATDTALGAVTNSVVVGALVPMVTTVLTELPAESKMVICVLPVEAPPLMAKVLPGTAGIEDVATEVLALLTRYGGTPPPIK